MEESAATGGSSGRVMLKVLAAQVLAGALVAVVSRILWGGVAGYSALLGMATAALPNAFLALRLAVPRRDPGAAALLRAARIGEIGKLALTVLMFSIVFVAVRPLAAGPFFAGFIVTALMPFAGLLMAEPVPAPPLPENDNENGNDTDEQHGE